MKTTNKVIYMVTYFDDEKQKHMAFVKGFSAVKFLEDRFGWIGFHYEVTENYVRTEEVKMA